MASPVRLGPRTTLNRPFLARQRCRLSLLSLVLSGGGFGPSLALGSVLDLRLAPSLEKDRDSYRQTIETSTSQVTSWFAQQGYTLPEDAWIGAAIVFDDQEAARIAVASHFGVDPTSIPASFSGTVDGDTLYVVSRKLYRATYTSLYPEWPWTDESYGRLVTHELAHRAHALIAQRQFGSEDAMGPRWFFEGLAILCAGNFDRGAGPMLSRSAFADYVKRDEREALSYPIYARMIRFLSSAVPVRRLIEHAREPDFPENVLDGLEAPIG